MDGTDVIQSILASEHDTVDPKLPHDGRTGRVVDSHLGRSVDLEIRICLLDQTDETNILHDRGVNASVDRFSQKFQGLTQLCGFYEGVEREVDTNATLMRDATRDFEFVERKLGAIVAGVEFFGAKINRVGAIGDGGSGCV